MVIQAALARSQTLGPAFALLFCHENRSGLYRKLGFQQVDDAVLVEQPDRQAPMPQMTMWQSLREQAVWPTGPVLVKSMPF